MKFKPKIIGPINRPVMLIGERPNLQRPGYEPYSLTGNRTGDFIAELIDGRKNLVLTNVVNVYYPGKKFLEEYVEEGIMELQNLMDVYQPYRIAAFGLIAQRIMKRIDKPQGSLLYNLQHPSYINRFKYYERSNYINQYKQILWPS